MSKPYKSVRVFKNPLLERLTHVHPIIPLLIWGPIALYLMWRTFAVHDLSPYTVGVLSVAGFVSWTLAEYVLHRYLFHYEGESALAQKLHFLIHGLHHTDPIDPTRLVMPPAASVILAIVLFSAFKSLMGPAMVDPFFAFFLVGYLCYDYIHFAVHHFVPRTRLGKFLKNNHMQHHFVSPNSRWGVSSPFWDYVFNTLEEAKNEKQATQ